MSRNKSRIALSIFVFIVAASAGIYLYLRFGPLPVAVADSPFPYEKQIVRIPLRARIQRQTKPAPFAGNEEIFEVGAQVYQEQCAACHGTPGNDSPLAKNLYPAAPQLWKKHGAHGVVGVSEEETGFTYWIVSNGIRTTGMPAFGRLLSDTERWQVSLLLKNADKDLSPQVKKILGVNAH